MQKADGYDWFKIKLDDGTIGYVVSNYIAYYSGKENTNKEDKKENVEDTNNTDKEINAGTKPIETKNIKLDKDKLALTVIPEVNGKIISEDLQIKNYTITDSKGNKIEKEALVGTGYKITDTDNKITYTVIKLGDANGDGKINSADLLTIQKHLLSVKKITDTNKINSSDSNGDGKINSADLLKIQKHLLNVSKISL